MNTNHMPAQAVSALKPHGTAFNEQFAKDTVLLIDLDVNKEYAIADAISRQQRLVAAKAPQLMLPSGH